MMALIQEIGEMPTPGAPVSAYTLRQALQNLLLTLYADVPEEARVIRKVKHALKLSDRELRPAAQYATDQLGDSPGSIAIAIVDVATALGVTSE